MLAFGPRVVLRYKRVGEAEIRGIRVVRPQMPPAGVDLAPLPGTCGLKRGDDVTRQVVEVVGLHSAEVLLHPLALPVVHVSDAATDADQPVLGIIAQVIAGRRVVAQIACGIVKRIAVRRVTGNVVVDIEGERGAGPEPSVTFCFQRLPNRSY